MSKHIIYTGDIIKVLKNLQDGSVDLAITSPPYFGLRSYTSDNKLKTYEIGLEPHPKIYIDRMIKIIKEVMRVLKDTGQFFLNIGDSYATASGEGAQDRLDLEFNKTLEIGHRTKIRRKLNKSGENWLKTKQKLLIPHRIAIRVQDELGYWIRDDIIWAKKVTLYPEQKTIGTCMPFPVKDRLASSHEYIFQIVKNPKYFADLEPVKCELKRNTPTRAQCDLGKTYEIQDKRNPHTEQKKGIDNKKLQNGKVVLRSNWNIEIKNKLENANPTNVIMFKRNNRSAIEECHFATFPKALPEFFIKWASKPMDTILDPFAGTGTTNIVAEELGRNSIGIELNPKYVEIIKKRFEPYLKQSKLNGKTELIIK